MRRLRHQRLAFNGCRNGTARSASRSRAPNGSKIGAANCFRSNTSTSSSPCRKSSPLSRTRTSSVVYDILFSATAETLRTIAADPKHLVADIGFIALLQTWGQSLLHHPHLHCVVPGGGISPDGQRWIACRPGFILPVRVLSRLFRRLFIAQLCCAFDEGALHFSRNSRSAPGDRQVVSGASPPCGERSTSRRTNAQGLRAHTGRKGQKTTMTSTSVEVV